MLTFPGLNPVDYLLLGHITQDITPDGNRPGGTVAFSGITARALGLRVGIVTAWGEETGTEYFDEIAIANQACEASSTFENKYTPEGRVQTITHRAPDLDFYHIPETWRQAPIIHLAPIAREIPPSIVRLFPNANVYLTPQGWLRQWDQHGNVFLDEWPEAAYILQQAHAAVISEEDVHGDHVIIEAMASATPILAVTKGALGVNIYAEGKIYSIPAPQVAEVDPTGSGDIFAAAFFSQLSDHKDPIQAAKFAVLVASDSVTRSGLASAPTEQNLYNLNKEVQ